jgi:hypothetical protein
MQRKYVIAGVVVLLVVLAVLLVADPAFAAKDARGIGNGIKSQLSGLGKPIVAVVGGFIGIAALVKRNWPEGLSILGLTALVSALLWAPNEIGQSAEQIAKAIF